MPSHRPTPARPLRRRGRRLGSTFVPNQRARTMNVDARPYRTLWPTEDGRAIEVIDQTLLPHRFATRRIGDLDSAVEAIKTMVVRGAPLIGASAAYGLALALKDAADDAALERAYRSLLASRPTAVNLRWALDDIHGRVRPLAPRERA